MAGRSSTLERAEVSVIALDEVGAQRSALRSLERCCVSSAQLGALHRSERNAQANRKKKRTDTMVRMAWQLGALHSNAQKSVSLH